MTQVMKGVRILEVAEQTVDLLDEHGKTFVIAPTKDEYHELAVNELPGRTLASIAAACSGLRTASVTACPRSRSSTANAVPQAPPPTTETLTTYSLLRKSIDTGTPSSSKRRRNSFSTQYA